MKNILPFQSRPGQSSARVVDGKLILSFPGAINPVLWQMELNEAKASALEVLPAGDAHVLMLRSARGEKLEIAPFATRAEAVDALMAVSRALESAHGRIRGSNGGIAALRPANENKHSRWITGIVGMLFVFILFMVWGSLAPQPAKSPSSSARVSTSAEPPAGVPLSADDYLKGR